MGGRSSKRDDTYDGYICHNLLLLLNKIDKIQHSIDAIKTHCLQQGTGGQQQYEMAQDNQNYADVLSYPDAHQGSVYLNIGQEYGSKHRSHFDDNGSDYLPARRPLPQRPGM